MMNFWRDNFSGDSGKWTDHTTDCAIAFSGGGKTFTKSAASWDTGGQIIIEERTLQAGDEIEFTFQCLTNTPGTPSESSSSFIEFSLRLDSATFSHSNYGMYIQGSDFYGLNNSPQEPPLTGLEINKRYRCTIEIDPDSGMSVWMQGGSIGGNVRIASFSGPFINRDAYFVVNIYSADTIRMLDFRGRSA